MHQILTEHVMAVFAAFCIICAILIWRWTAPEKEAPLPAQSVEMRSRDYARGVNAALDGIILLHLEQELTGTNRTLGAMADLVCRRLQVQRKLQRQEEK